MARLTDAEYKRLAEIDAAIAALKQEGIAIIKPTETEINEAAEYYFENRKEAVELVLSDDFGIAHDVLQLREMNDEEQEAEDAIPDGR